MRSLRCVTSDPLNERASPSMVLSVLDSNTDGVVRKIDFFFFGVLIFDAFSSPPLVQTMIRTNGLKSNCPRVLLVMSLLI